LEQKKKSQSLKKLKQQVLLLSSFLSLNCIAEETTQEQAEPAAFILLVLGLAALFLGMRNLRELRHKHMIPPRPDPSDVQKNNINTSGEQPRTSNSSPDSL